MQKLVKGGLVLAAAVVISAIPALATPVAVPEPASFGLLISGIAGLAVFRQVRKG